MEAVRIVFYALTILSATVTWCLAASFLALTHNHLNHFWRGDVALLVFDILAMSFLPCLMFLGFGHRRRSLTGPTIAESITVFIFWCLFLSATAKFSRTYHGLTGWNNRCRFGFHMCPTGRALLAFGWITFGLLSALLVVVILHGILHERKRKHEETADVEAAQLPPGGRQNDPSLTNSQATAVAGKQPGGGPVMTQAPAESAPVVPHPTSV